MDSTIDLKLSGQLSFRETVHLLQERTGYNFAYGRAGESKCRISLPDKEVPLNTLLDVVFNPCHIQWSLIGTHIVLTPINMPHEGYKIFGRILDRTNHMPLEYATIYIPGTSIGTQTDTAGRFTLTGISHPKLQLNIQLIGYHSRQRYYNILKHTNKPLTIELEPHIIPLSTAILRYDRLADQTTISQMTLERQELDHQFNISDDPLKTVAQLPSVASNGDLLSSDKLYIRGGEPEENLLLLDNVRFLWPYYIGGASVFNPEVMEKVEVLSGQFKAKYGQAMSGIINLTTRNGSTDHFKSTLGLSVFHSSFLVEGPFKHQKSSYLIAFRKTNRFPFTEIITAPPKTNDFTIKLFFKLGKNHRISYTNIGVVDRFDLNRIRIGQDSFHFPISSNNSITGQSLQWQATFFGKLYNKLSVHTSEQKIRFSIRDSTYPRLIHLNNGHLSLRNDLSAYLDAKNKIETGFDFNLDGLNGKTKGIYDATDIDIRDSSLLYFQRDVNTEKLYLAGYVHYEHTFNRQLHSAIGLRTDISNNKYILTYSPRISLAYQYNDKVKITGFTGLFRQDPDLSNGDSLGRLLPNQVWQFNLGAQYKRSTHTYLWTELYYKHYQHLVILNPDFEYDNSGKAEVAGLELFAQFERKQTTFRLSYSLSKARRKRSLQTQTHLFFFDQTHRLNAYFRYTRAHKKITLLPRHTVLNFRIYSGTPYTSVLGYEMVDSRLLPVYSPINSYKNPWYHTLNTRFVWSRSFGKKERFQMDFMIEFWNLFNALNISERKYTPQPNNPSQVQEILQYHEGRIPNIGLKIRWK